MFISSLWRPKKFVAWPPCPKQLSHWRGCSHRSLRTVNPQVRNGPRFAMRNNPPSCVRNEETPDVTKNLGQTGEVTSGGFQALRKGVPILHCEMFCDNLAVWKHWSGRRVSAITFRSLCPESANDQKTASRLTGVRAGARKTLTSRVVPVDRSDSNDRP